MAEPDDPESLPTQTWGGGEEAPTIPATPPPARDPSPAVGSRRGGWQPPTPEELQPSFSQYEIRALVGRGGMGAVYQGWQKSLRRFVAIKILPPQLGENDDANFTQRFQREAQAMARFAHPGIVSVFDAGETPKGLLYFVMEYVEGTDVQKMVTSQGRLPPEHALAITGHVCDALAYAHRRGVIHRDIKPSNIMVDSEGQVKVADFGLAKVATDDSAALLTGTHMRMGTPDFMAPESMLGVGKVDHRADLYAVGVMLYQMLTGQLPRGRFEPPSHRIPGLDVRFDGIVDHALQTDPGKRYSSAAEIRTDLDRILTEPAPQSSVVEPLPPLDQRKVSHGETAGDTQATQVESTPSSPQNVAVMKAIPLSSTKGSRLPLYGGIAAAVMLALGGMLLLPRVKPNGKRVTQPAPPEAKSDHPIFPVTAPANATKEKPFVNTLGQEFVPVPGAQALFCRWDTRVKDYAAYAGVNKVDGAWSMQQKDGVPVSREPNYPVVGVSWDDATAFCQWLTDKEIADGKLPQGLKYRLPTDEEWSRAAGLAKEEGGTPSERSGNNQVDYPWGIDYPPKKAKVGNYADAAWHEKFPKESWIDGYTDGYATTSPVGSFAPNEYGLYDMGGNVWQWCTDLFEQGSADRVLRGASWAQDARNFLLSSHRYHSAPGLRGYGNGFRCVVAPASTSPPATAPAQVVSSTSAVATMESPFVNSLGMKFVQVPITGGPTSGQRVLFNIWETRVQDYATFVTETKREWPKVAFAQDPKHPAVNVSWDDAQAFCAWLTERERKSGKLAATERYRLPTDHEWSCAVGIGDREDPGRAPAEKDKVIPDTFPWGGAWPPPPGAGNYSGEEAARHKSWEGQKILTGYSDTFFATAPCGSFPANRLGIFDLGGNAWEWCEDFFKPGDEQRTVRGASYAMATRGVLLSSARFHVAQTMHDDSTGFRCVLAVNATERPVRVPVESRPAAATTKSPFVNSLGMKFVPVPITGGPTNGQRVLFSIWETRTQDCDLFAEETGREWLKSDYAPSPTHPAEWTSWDDAQAFCTWLTDRERKSGRIAANERYRLPTDHEWSCAVGIGNREDPAKLPSEKSGKITDEFPWGKGWPPPRGAGNYSGEEAVGHETSKAQEIIKGYRDEFPNTAPVGSFAPNRFGLFDLGGNVWEWCQDWFDRDQQRRVARGAADDSDTRGTALSSYRGRGVPTLIGFGFRCVLATDALGVKTAEAPPVAAPQSIAAILISPDYEWSKPENLGAGVNSRKDDYSPGLSDDGLILVFSSTRNGTEHLFECRRKSVDELFGNAVPIKDLNTAGEQSGPFLTGDGLTLLYHATQGPRHQGSSDIYQTHRLNRDALWQLSVNLGSRVNTAAAEEAPCLSPDGLTLLFHSNRPGGQGGYDLWRSRRESLESQFNTPENLGKGVNTDGKEFSPAIASDNKTILFVRSTERAPHKLFIAVPDANGSLTARALDLPVNGGIQSPTLSFDGQILYFASDMPGGYGGWDLWQIRRVAKAGTAPP